MAHFAEALRLEVRRGLGELRLDSLDLLRLGRRRGRHPGRATVRRRLEHQRVARRGFRRLGLEALADTRNIAPERRQILVSAVGSRSRHL